MSSAMAFVSEDIFCSCNQTGERESERASERGAVNGERGQEEENGLARVTEGENSDTNLYLFRDSTVFLEKRSLRTSRGHCAYFHTFGLQTALCFTGECVAGKPATVP